MCDNFTEDMWMAAFLSGASVGVSIMVVLSVIFFIIARRNIRKGN